MGGSLVNGLQHLAHDPTNPTQNPKPFLLRSPLTHRSWHLKTHPEEALAPHSRKIRVLPIFPEKKTMNFATSICSRLGLKNIVTNTPVYSSASDVTAEGLSLTFRRWATKKSAGSTKNGRDSNPKFLGVKKFGGERVIPGNIIVRQRGTRFHPGNYVGLGKDHTLFALKEGSVKFEHHKLSGRKWVHIVPKEGHVLHPVYANGATAPSAA